MLPISGFNRAPKDEEFTLYNAHAQSRFDSVRAALGFQLQRIAGLSILNDTVSARVLQLRRQAWPLILDAGQWFVAAGSRAAEAYSIAPGDTLKLHGHLPPAQRPLSEAVGVDCGFSAMGTYLSSMSENGSVAPSPKIAIRARPLATRRINRFCSSW